MPKCPYCGSSELTLYPDNSGMCKECGKSFMDVARDISVSLHTEQDEDREVGIKESATITCSECGNQLDENAKFCSFCGASTSIYRISQFIQKKPLYYKEVKSRKPDIAGILLITAGVLALLNNVFAVFLFFSFDSMVCCLSLCTLFGFIALIGGVFSIRRDEWNFVMIAGVLGIFSLGPLFSSSILSLIALLFVSSSKEEYS